MVRLGGNMLIVKVKDGKIEKALKQLKRKVNQTKLVRELRENEQFTKPSVKRREEIKKAQYIQKMRDAEED